MISKGKRVLFILTLLGSLALCLSALYIKQLPDVIEAAFNQLRDYADRFL